MQILTIIAGIIVFAFCIFLIGLAVMIILKPKRAEDFLKSYASSARAHYVEQVLRLAAGTALVIFSPLMWFPRLWYFFGWIIIITTIGLLLVPWKWHHKFGEWAIPLTLRFVKFYSFGAFALGLFLLYCLSAAVMR